MSHIIDMMHSKNLNDMILVCVKSYNMLCNNFFYFLKYVVMTFAAESEILLKGDVWYRLKLGHADLITT